MTDAVHFGPLFLSIRTAAFLLSLALTLWIATQLARRLGVDAPRSRRIATAGTLAGLLAGRFAFVALNWQAFSAEPWTALYLWRPGYLPLAGLAVGALYVTWRLRLQTAERRLPYFRALGSGFAAGAVLLALALGAASWLSGAQTLRAGDSVPDFRLQDLSGAPVALSDLEGKGVVLNFWATWCPPCRREMPWLESAWNEYRARNVVVVGIALGQSRDEVRPFVDAMGATYPIWTDAAAADDGAPDSNDIFAWFASAGLPTTVFIRPDGTIDKVQIGELDRSLLREELPRLVP